MNEKTWGAWPGLVIAWAAVMLCGCMLSACGKPAFLEPQDVNPSWAPDSTQVVFTCYRRQRTTEWDLDTPYLGPYSGLDASTLLEICVSDINGSNRRQLTDNMVFDGMSSWSPTGDLIAFVSERDASRGADIYVMLSDGTNIVNLTENAAGYSKPHWSPDGSAIAFTSNRDNISRALYIMAIDSKRVTRLAEMEWILHLSWSPDGRFIAFDGLSPDRHPTVFDSSSSSRSEIFVVNVEDGSIARMTDNQVADSEPVWSPDGRRIVFRSQRYDGYQIYVMDVQTREEIKISEGPELGSWPSWSPDGRFLAYTSREAGSIEQTLHILDTETGTSRSFAGFQAIDEFLWSPDGRYLIYERLEDWNEDGFKEVKLRVLQVDDGTEWGVSSMK